MDHDHVNSNEKLVLETEFNSSLSKKYCTKLILDLIKYILYNKQQLPYTFERLGYLVKKKRDSVEPDIGKKVTSTKVDRLFKVAEVGFQTLEELFEKTKLEFLKTSKINEIALLFGNSPLSPKQVYHIHLPDSYCDDALWSFSYKQCQLQLLQSIIQSDKLNEMLTKPMNPTNMYMFIRKDGNCDTSQVNFCFLPKNRFRIPSCGQHFHIKLLHPSPNNAIDVREKFLVYSDDSMEMSSPSHPQEILENAKSCVNSNGMETEWFQAYEVFRGFKDVFINGVSVSTLWTK